jgi:putative hydrolase of the HAD superfamily
MRFPLRDPQIKAVIFDLDDTLLNCYYAIQKASLVLANFLERKLARLGIRVEKEKIVRKIDDADLIFNKKFEFNRDEWWRWVLRELGYPFLGEKDYREMTRLYWRIINRESKLFPEARELLQELKRRGIKIGLLTDTDFLPGVKERRIRRSGVLRWIDRYLIAGEHTREVKPSPKPLLLLIEKLGVKREECIYVGDKPFSDVPTGRKAGVRTLWLDRGRWNSKLRCKKIKSLREVLNYLKG